MPGAAAPPETAPGGPQAPIRPKTSGWAIASLVMGILGFTCLFFVGAILAVIFGFIGRHDIYRSEGRLTGKGLATAGIALGIVMLALTVLLAAVLIPLSYVVVGPSSTINRTVSPGSASTIDATVAINNGDLRITGGANALMEGTFTYNVSSWRPSVRYSVDPSGTGDLSVRQPTSEWWHWWQWLHGTNDWNLHLGTGLPVNLRTTQSFGEGRLDLAGINLSTLDASSSAGNLTASLPGNMPSLQSIRVDISAGKLTFTMNGRYSALEALDIENSAGTLDADLTGTLTRSLSGTIRNSAGTINVRLPADIGVYIVARTSAGDVSTNGLTSRGNDVFVNNAYGKAQVTLKLHINNFAGNIDLTVE